MSFKGYHSSYICVVRERERERERTNAAASKTPADIMFPMENKDPDRDSVTGNMHALDKQHFDVMKDGVALANAGHFDVEINLKALKEHSSSVDRVRDHVDSYKYNDKEILVLAEGRLVNLAAATGHPASVMDMSFANQALAAEWIKDNYKSLEPKVYTLPKEVDLKIAATKLGLMGGELEILTEEQIKYLDSWEHGTS